MAAAFGPVRVVAATVAFEQFDGVVDDVLDVRGVPHREGGQLLERHPLVHEGTSGDEHVDGIGGEALVVALADRGQQPGAHDDIDEELGDLGATGEFGLVEVGVDSVLLGEIDEQAGAVAGGQFTDLGEAEPLLGERADLLDSFEVGVVVERPTALSPRWGEQLFALVVPDRVDRDPGGIGQLFNVVVHALIVGVTAPRVATRTVARPTVSGPLGFGPMSYDASGMLSDPLDPNAPRTRKRDYPVVVARRGVVLEDRTTGVVGALVSFAPPRLVLRDRYGKDHTVRYADGSVRADIDNKGVPCKLVPPRTEPEGPKITASGSIDAGDVPTRVARASRIWVEGIHDAELIEKVWGADLRVEGVVVEQLEGADDLAERVRGFRPGDRRRLGILLDHLVDGSKESRIAAEIDDRNVRITGHPYVDIWQAVKPSVIGIDHWPEVPKGQPWKEGVISALGITATPASFWKHVLGKVTSWKDLETPLLGAVEELIDFVAPPEP